MSKPLQTETEVPLAMPHIPHEAGIQISLRIPRAALARLNALAEASVQTKSQFITRLLQRIPESYLVRSDQTLPEGVMKKVYTSSKS
jgi:hypothetical protein